jgi:hypothetical protein
MALQYQKLGMLAWYTVWMGWKTSSGFCFSYALLFLPHVHDNLESHDPTPSAIEAYQSIEVEDVAARNVFFSA